MVNKTDLQLKHDIQAELQWDPRLNAAQIGVTVNDGAVTLLGTVDSYAEKWAAEEAMKRVSGVRTVAQDLKVMLTNHHKHDDQEIAGAIASSLKWNVFIPETITAKVRHGEVTLEGLATWKFQRDAALHVARHVRGVVLVHDLITLKPHLSASKTQVKESIEAALQRQATADARSIHVETSGGRVTLTGHATSWQSIEDAANAAWAAPGVTEVVDQVKHTMSTV
jgi:osmotically-inducible protein OsmY